MTFYGNKNALLGCPHTSPFGSVAKVLLFHLSLCFCQTRVEIMFAHSSGLLNHEQRTFPLGSYTKWSRMFRLIMALSWCLSICQIFHREVSSNIALMNQQWFGLRFEVTKMGPGSNWKVDLQDITWKDQTGHLADVWRFVNISVSSRMIPPCSLLVFFYEVQGKLFHIQGVC